MARHTEPLSRGLVTIRDPSLLKEGELSRIRNAVYLPGSNAIQRARGRAAFGSATADDSDVDGLRDAKFDNGNHYLIAHVASSYVSAAVGDTGTFGTLVSGVGNGDQLEVVHYRNRFFLFNGTSADASAIGTNKVIYLSATAVANTLISRQHGMLPVRSAPRITTAAGTASQTVTGYYEYWTTEVARITQDGTEISLEGTFSSDSGPTTVYITATGQVPVIEMPLVNNSITTHWRIYRSPKKEKESDKKFPSGFMIAEIATGTTAVSDHNTVASASSFPTSYNTVAPFAGFTNRTNLGADDGSYASATVGATFVPAVQAAYGFNFGGFAGSVKGIAVEFQAYVPSGVTGVPVEVTIGRRATDGSFQRRKGFGSTPPSRSAIVTATAAGTPQTITVGGSTDRWFGSDQQALADSDFDGNFMLTIGTSKLNTSVGIDYVKPTVYYQATVESVVPFPTVAYTFGDITAQVGKNGPPPSSSTGTLFEDCLVVNDISNPSLVRYSYPGDPEAFPETYYIDFETRENDQVRFIGKVNGRLVVGLDSSIWRVNYLPSERDASFDRGKAIELISPSFGVVDPMCACIFSTDGEQERLAFVSHQGVHTTDGYDLQTWSSGLDWRGDRDGLGIANTTNNYSPVALINDQENDQLEFYFRNDAIGTGGNFWKLTFQYSDMQEAGPRVAGMVAMRNVSGGALAVPRSAWSVIRNTGVAEVFLGYGASGAGSTAAGAGQVWRETGNTIPASEARMSFSTRRFYLAGMGHEWKLNEMYGYAGLNSLPQASTIVYATDNRKTDYNGSYVNSKTYTIDSGTPLTLLHKVNFNQMCEGMLVNATVSGEGSYAQEYLILDGEDFGLEDSGL